MGGATKTRASRSGTQARFARPGASTTRSGSQTRFGRPGGSATRSTPQTRFGRPSAHRGRSLRRRQPQPTGLKKMLGSVLSGGAVKKAAPSSKKGAAGGLALAAAAAGMAFKNRDKLRKKDTMHSETPVSPVGNASTPATPPITPPI